MNPKIEISSFLKKRFLTHAKFQLSRLIQKTDIA
jgi:hypothetical protein